MTRSSENGRGAARSLIVGGQLFTGTDSYADDAAVLVEGDRIVAVGRRADFGEHLEHVDVVDATGSYIMPGLINTHVHLTFNYKVGLPTDNAHAGPTECAVHAVRVAALLLSQGITTARDMGGQFNVPLDMRAAIADGRLPGPHMIVCNQPIAITGGHAAFVSTRADGADQFRQRAREQLRLGADFIKVMASHDPWLTPGPEATRPELTVEEMTAAFEVAHAWGRPTGCHVMGSTAIRRVVESGVDVIEHGQYLTLELAKSMVQRDVSFTPTLSSYDTQTMHPRFQRGAEWAHAHEALLAGHKQAIDAALEAGVRILNGTDSVGCYAEEVQLLREAGMSAADSLLTCTRNPAQALRIDDEVGTVEAGKRADLVILGEDPLADAYGLEAVESVIKSGRFYSPGELTYLERTTRPEWNMAELARHPAASGAHHDARVSA